MRKMTQAPAHKAGAYIFKRQGGSMKKLQGRYAFIHRHQRNGKVDGFFYNGMQCIIRYGSANIRLYEAKRNFFIAVLRYVIKKSRFVYGNGMRKIQSLIRRLSFYGGF